MDQARLGRAWSGQAGPGCTWLGQAQPGRTWPRQAQPGRIWPHLAKPGRARTRPARPGAPRIVTPAGEAGILKPAQPSPGGVIPGFERGAAPTEMVTLRLRRVLIVDEALPIRRKLLDILHRAGVAAAEITQCDNAEDAMEQFARVHPTLVFCELVGDAQGGLEMILEMLQLDPQAKIVLVTAEDPNAAIVRQAIRAGVFGVVRKPLRHESIRQVLTEIESEEGGIERFR